LFTLNNCAHALETSSFLRHEKLQNGETSLDKEQSQDQTRKKSMNFIQIEGKISPKVTRPRLVQSTESEAASASSLDVSAVSRKVGA